MRQNIENARYNANTTGKHKSVKKGKKNLIKLVIGCAVVVSICKLSDVYNDTKAELIEERGIGMTEGYSPSGGPISIYTEDVSASDVFDRMGEDIRGRSR